MLISIHLR